MQIIQVGI